MALYRFKHQEIAEYCVDVEADDLVEAEAKMQGAKQGHYMDHLSKCPEKYQRKAFGVHGIYYRGYTRESILQRTFTSEEAKILYPEETCKPT